MTLSDLIYTCHISLVINTTDSLFYVFSSKMNVPSITIKIPKYFQKKMEHGLEISAGTIIYSNLVNQYHCLLSFMLFTMGKTNKANPHDC